MSHDRSELVLEVCVLVYLCFVAWGVADGKERSRRVLLVRYGVDLSAPVFYSRNSGHINKNPGGCYLFSLSLGRTGTA